MKEYEEIFIEVITFFEEVVRCSYGNDGNGEEWDDPTILVE